MSGSGSDYWYGESGVVRYSDHWGSEVASCDWYLDGVARCDLPDWIRAEASVKRHAAAVREAAVLLEAAGVAVDYTYMPEETE